MKFTAKQLAQKANVSEPAITKALNKGLLIKGKDKKFDSSHPRNKVWLSEHNVRFESVVIPDKSKIKTLEGEFVGDDGEVRTFEELTGLPNKFLNMTMKEICFHYGDLKTLKNIADTLEKIMSSAQKEVKMQQIRKELIPRDFVQSNIFSYIDLLNSKVISYVENSLRDEIKKIKADPNCESELKTERRKNIAKIISDAKKEINNAVRRMKVSVDEE